MPVYLVSSYNVLDYAAYKTYPPKIAPWITRYGGKVLAMEMNPESLQGKAQKQEHNTEISIRVGNSKFIQRPRVSYHHPHTGGFNF